MLPVPTLIDLVCDISQDVNWTWILQPPAKNIAKILKSQEITAVHSISITVSSFRVNQQTTNLLHYNWTNILLHKNTAAQSQAVSIHKLIEREIHGQFFKETDNNKILL